METELVIKHNGKDFPVNVNYEGEFTVNLGVEGGSSVILKAKTYADLKKQAAKIKTAFELPFTITTPTTTRHGKVTGIHASNGNVLVKWDDGSTEQLHSWEHSTGAPMPRLSDEDDATLRRMIADRNRTARELEQWIKPRQWTSLKQAAMKARDDAAAKETADESA